MKTCLIPVTFNYEATFDVIGTERYQDRLVSETALLPITRLEPGRLTPSLRIDYRHSVDRVFYSHADHDAMMIMQGGLDCFLRSNSRPPGQPNDSHLNKYKLVPELQDNAYIKPGDADKRYASTLASLMDQKTRIVRNNRDENLELIRNKLTQFVVCGDLLYRNRRLPQIMATLTSGEVRFTIEPVHKQQGDLADNEKLFPLAAWPGLDKTFALLGVTPVKPDWDVVFFEETVPACDASHSHPL